MYADRFSYFHKMSFLVGLILFCGISGVLMLKLTGTLTGLELNSEQDLKDLLQSGEHTTLLKLMIGANHILVFILAPALYLIALYPGRIRKFLGLTGYPFTLLLFCIILLYISYPVMSFLAEIMDKIAWPEWMHTMDKNSMEQLAGVLKMENYFDLAVNLIIVAVLPGVGEELLFRGIVQNEMLKRTGKPVLSILLTAAIFSAFHFQVSGFFPKFIIGSILGFAYFIAKDIRLPMLLHALNNGMATMAYFIAGSDFSSFENSGEGKISPLAALTSLVLGLLLTWYIHSKYKNPGYAEESGA